MLRHEIGSAGFAIGELRMLVDVAPPGQHFPLNLRRAAVDLGIEPARLGVERPRQSGACQEG